MADANLYVVNDVIEYDNDGTIRTVSDVNETTDIVTFTPDLDANSVVGIAIFNWGIGATDLDEDFHIDINSPCFDAGDPNGDYDGLTDIDGQARVKAHEVDIGADEVAVTLYADANAGSGGDGLTWDNAFDELQDALSIASADDQIWVAEGTYMPDVNDPNNRSRSFDLVEGVDVYGGFPEGGSDWSTRDWDENVTILTGDINVPDDANDNSYHVVVGANDVILDGFTITGGKANGSSPDIFGGGIYCDGTSPTIRNCTITENEATNGAGINNRYSSAVLVNCSFADNTATGSGGGMENMHSSPTIVNCLFMENDGGVEGGGICYGDSSPDLTNCLFYDNTAQQAGGIYNDSSSPTITNCTFAYNNATTYQGGGILNTNPFSTPLITNCIFWGNDANQDGNQIYNTGSAAPNFAYCDIEDSNGSGANWETPLGSDDGNNIDENPSFGCVGSDDYRLDLHSPCIDAGNDDALPADTTDLDNDGNTTEDIPLDIDGDPRVAGDNVEIGADEIGFDCGCLGDLNGDGWLSPTDQSALVSLLLPWQSASYWMPCTAPSYNPCGDMTGDHWLSPTDISALISILLPYESSSYWKLCDE